MYNHSHDGGLLAQIVSNQLDINVYGLDFINAGQSQSDEPGYYKSVDYLVQQAYAFIRFILNKSQTSQKIFVSGASMGGMICFELALRYPNLLSGIIFLAGAIR